MIITFLLTEFQKVWLLFCRPIINFQNRAVHRAAVEWQSNEEKKNEIYANNILIVWDNIKRLDYGKVAPPKTNSFYFGSRIMKNNCKNN